MYNMWAVALWNEIMPEPHRVPRAAPSPFTMVPNRSILKLPLPPESHGQKEAPEIRLQHNDGVPRRKVGQCPLPEKAFLRTPLFIASTNMAIKEKVIQRSAGTIPLIILRLTCVERRMISTNPVRYIAKSESQLSRKCPGGKGRRSFCVCARLE